MKHFVRLAGLAFVVALLAPAPAEAQMGMGSSMGMSHGMGPSAMGTSAMGMSHSGMGSGMGPSSSGPRSVPELDGRAAPAALFLLIAGGLVMLERRRRLS